MGEGEEEGEVEGRMDGWMKIQLTEEAMLSFFFVFVFRKKPQTFIHVVINLTDVD